MGMCRVEIDRTLSGPDDINGEIIIYGPNVMQGYYNKPDATSAVMTPDGGFRSGDCGHFDEDGFLYITGRLKEQYKLENGKYVYPAAIEGDIRLNVYIDNAMIYGEGREYNVCLVFPDFTALAGWAQKNNLPTAPAELVKKDELKTFLTAEIEKSLKGKYGAYEIPRKFVFIAEPLSVDTGLLTQTMKLKRRVVSDRYSDQINALYAK